MFSPYLERWSLTSDGEPIITHSSRLLPVIWQDKPAMLKVATDSSERDGALLMKWWDGDGAARVYAHEGDAVLLERATDNIHCLIWR
ncbi:streptomycin 6-kinase [Rhizobium sp. BK316]|nr:streptomycin 6-kinase [Rhizobium sp. BK316]